ncbi:Hypothetical predicted protein [Pelobates cultripes]|uniref:Uncharacterized protein n=1 Tax=Pelobates cultripes TaxID=61616 RepID=A0AAD1SB85_PELCU|nr:Hypothetical predicted protein [Pelobates cultripes]
MPRHRMGLLNDVQVTVVNLYAPNTNQYDFIRKGLQQVDKQKSGHIFWYCPALSQYWQQIQDTIKSKLGKQLPLKPEHYLLHMLPRDLTAYEAALTTHITLAAKTCIAALWKTTTVPDINAVLAKVSLTQQYEQMAHTIAGTLEHYNRTWSKW